MAHFGEQTVKQIAAIFRNVVLAEIRDLEDLRKDIRFCPEIAYAYLCGKALAQSDIFTGQKIDWRREERLVGNSGPTDLIFRINGVSRIAVEFKMVSTRPKYASDIEKLKALSPDCEIKLFCAIIDAWSKDGSTDRRICTVDARDDCEKIVLEAIGNEIDVSGQSAIQPYIGIWKIR